MSSHRKSIIKYWIFLIILHCGCVLAQHNQWVVPITLHRKDFTTQPDWDNSNNDKFAPIAYDNEKSTYFAGDYHSGSLWLGNEIKGPYMVGNNPGLYIAKIDSAGNPKWIKLISRYSKYNSLGTCFSRIANIEYDSIRNRIWFCFKTCNIGSIDSYDYEFDKYYLGAISAETNEAEFLQEVPGITNFYLKENHIVALTRQLDSQTLDSIVYEKGYYFTNVDYSGNIISRTRVINPDPDPESPALYITAIAVKDIIPTPNGNTIIIGSTNEYYSHQSMVGTTLIDTIYNHTLFVINLSPEGETIWSKMIYATKERTHWLLSTVSAKVNLDGSVIFSARFYDDIIIDDQLQEYEASASNTYAKCFIIKIQPDGHTSWYKTFEVANFPASVDESENIEVIFAGTARGRITIDDVDYVSQDSLLQYPRLFLLKFDSLGNVTNSKTIQGQGHAWSIKSINEDEQILYGRYFSAKNDSMFHVGYDSFNNRLGGAAYGFFMSRVSFTDLPEQSRLSEEELIIFANPNTGSCNVRVPIDFYNAPLLYLDIYNQSGQIISKNILNFQRDDIRLNIEAKANGIYPIRLSNGNKTYYGKIILAK